MSFPVEFAAGVKPNDRSELSSGLDFSRHPTSVYRSTDIVSEQLPSLSQLSDVSALARRGVDVGDTIRSEEVDKGESEKPYAERTLEPNCSSFYSHTPFRKIGGGLRRHRS
ncbi:hypothetical protein V865_003769 [Kwoniella europaea PYCC6329]|uniref:Uncharacterized protein n=1 Tax=Kwoniella europaea PYCC6329 TaxID=1423913 RepID=A0AAX4KIR0_9TREE